MTASKLVAIYALRCPHTGEVRYIGKANDPATRLRTHMADKRYRTPRGQWIRKLIAEGFVPVLEVLEWVPAAEWEAAERRLIAEYRLRGSLLNLADGGNQPAPSEGDRKRSGKALHRLMAEPVRRANANFMREFARQMNYLKSCQPERKGELEFLVAKVRNFIRTDPDAAFTALSKVQRFRYAMCLEGRK
jgi:hypothetical protein